MKLNKLFRLFKKLLIELSVLLFLVVIAYLIGNFIMNIVATTFQLPVSLENVSFFVFFGFALLDTLIGSLVLLGFARVVIYIIDSYEKIGD